MSDFIELTDTDEEGTKFYVRHSEITKIVAVVNMRISAKACLETKESECYCQETPAEVIEKINAAQGKS